MYRPPDSVIEHRLTRTFPAARLRRLARTTGLVERRRKLDAAALFWALTLGFAVGEDRSIEAFRQSYLLCVVGERSLTYASFHGWFATSLTAFLREVLYRALKTSGTRLTASTVGLTASATFSFGYNRRHALSIVDRRLSQLG